MPGLSGPQTVERIREFRPDIPALFVSGYADRDAGATALASSSYMQKPYESQALLECVRRLLEAAHR